MSTTVVVTGANGFVGRAVCAEVVRQGHGLRAVVRNGSTATGLPGEVAVVPDLGEAAQQPAIFSGAHAVIHLAARVHVMKETAADPLAEFRSVNVDLTEALAKAAAARGITRFVYVSSIKVNGEETPVRPFTAGDSPAPQDAYGVSKWEAERLLARIAGETGMEVAVVRPPLVYGPGVGGNFLRLLKLVDRGVPLPFGSVSNRRSMIYSRNLADALVACASHRNAAGKTFLVRDEESLSTAELVRRMAAALGKPARCLPFPVPALRFAGRCTGKSDEIQRLVSSLTVDDDGLRSALGWSPRYSIDEGLSETASWYRAERSRARGI